MQYLTLYIVLLVLILLSFLKGKGHLFKIIVMAYPTMIIYKAIVEYFGASKINTLFGQNIFINNLIIFLLVLIPVYIALMRIVDNYRSHQNIKGVSESALLSIGIVLLTIGICFHILPDRDIFNLDKPFEVFFQGNLGYLTCMIVPMLSVFLMSKKNPLV
jgi:hypothetical protein